MSEPHDWEGDGYACTKCWCSMHCTKCNRGCGGQGHLVKDDDGFYISCQEPERWERQRAAMWAAIGVAS